MSKFLTTGQAAILCSVTPDAVLKWIKAGKLPAQRTPGGHYRIRHSDLLAVASTGETPKTLKRVDDRPFQYCWEFNARSGKLAEGCQQCIVYRSRARRCYEMSRLPSNSGHARLFCSNSCEECEYYRLVRLQRQNVLIVTDQPALREALESGADQCDFNLRFTDCEYHCSMVVEKYRPDYVILDCSMGTQRAREFAQNIAADPRIPFVRIILMGERHEFPTECDKEIFATIERPLTAAVLETLINTLKQEVAASKIAYS